MLAIQWPRNKDRCTANILPCRIHHNGPAKVTKRYWALTTENDGTKTSYFRGRRLRGRVLKLPPGYLGLVAKSTDRTLPRPMKSRAATDVFNVDEEDDEADDEEDESDDEPVKLLEAMSNFDEIVVWGHDQVPAADDTFVKGVQEWIAFAEAIHGTAAKTAQGTLGDEAEQKPT